MREFVVGFVERMRVRVRGAEGAGVGGEGDLFGVAEELIGVWRREVRRAKTD